MSPSRVCAAFLTVLVLNTFVEAAGSLLAHRSAVSRRALPPTVPSRPSSRHVLQLDDDACTLSRRQRRRYREDAGVWRLDDEALEELENDVQPVVNCAEEGDTLLLDLSAPLRLPRRVLLPRPITISSATAGTRRRNGIFPLADEMVTINCPLENEGAFIALTQSVLFANVVFVNCSMTALADVQPIIEVGICPVDGTNGTLELHHVTFANNVLIEASALMVGFGSCTEVEMRDVQFVNNTCNGVCAAVLSPVNDLRDLHIENNIQAGREDFAPSILLSPSGSSTRIKNLTALNNGGSIVTITDGELRIRDAVFSSNIAQNTTFGLAYSASIDATSSAVDIGRCTFEGNRAQQGAGVLARQQSNVEIRDSSFIQNTAFDGGGAVRLFACEEVIISNTSFLGNRSPLRIGGAILSENTLVLDVRDSNFTENVAGMGGAIDATEFILQIENSVFRYNRAEESLGGALLFLNGRGGSCTSCDFFNNTAVSRGGCMYLEETTTFQMDNVTATSNWAEFGGCVASIRTSISVVNSTYSNNKAATTGGAIWGQPLSAASITDSDFTENKADGGSAVVLANVDDATVLRSRFQGNNASMSGGALWIDGGSGIVQECTFEENASQDFASALQCTANDRSTAMDVTSCAFHRNAAVRNGGSVALFAGCVVFLTNSTWIENHSSENGGAVMLRGAGAMFNDSTFLENSAQFGGAVYAEPLSNVTFGSVSFESNSAKSNGGGLGMHGSTVAISECNFQGNLAVRGAGFYVGTDAEATVDDTIFVENVANNSGGALYVVEGGLTLLNSSLENNVAESERGGAVYIATATSVASMQNLVFRSNSALTFGGAIYAGDGTILDLSDSELSLNFALDSGGAIASIEGDIRLQNVTVDECSVNLDGGGIYIERGSVTISDSDVSNNYAFRNGGGIYCVESSLMGEQLSMEQNIADGFAGGIYADFTEDVILSNCIFQNNYANFAGMALLFNATAVMTNVESHNNSAFFDGGFSQLRDGSTLRMDNCLVNQSRAEFGGAFYMEDGRLYMNNTEIVDTRATWEGGILYATLGSFVVVRNASFTRADAEIGASALLRQSYFWGLNLSIAESHAKFDGGAIFANESSSVLCANCTFESNSALGKGGAVSLESTKIQLLAFQFDDCCFHNNSAELGGALHFVSRDGDVDIDCSAQDARCTFVVLRGSSFIKNNASSAGGAILSSDLNALRYDCSYRRPSDPLKYITQRQFRRMDSLNATEKICADWEDNAAKGYGNTLASYARSVQRSVFYEDRNVTEEVEGGHYYVLDHQSGTQIPTLRFKGVDALGQGPATGSGNETIRVTMSTSDHLFSGSINIDLIDGVGNISGVAGYGRPGFYEVRVDFNESAILPMIMIVEVRECKIGEASTADGTICDRCDGDTYNFFPNDEDKRCLPCPEDAKCDAAMIRPRKGFWHLHPCSTDIEECLTERACDFENRDDILKDLVSDLEECEFSLSFLQTYADAQCREGYTGPLCGSCQSTYGRSRSFRCEKCYGGFSSFILVLFSVLVLLILSIFTIRSSLPVHRRPRPPQQPLRPVQRPPPPPPEVLNDEEVPVNLELVEMLVTGHVPSSKKLRHPASPRQQPILSESERAKLTELAKWKTVEIFKITLNYVQVIAIAMAINVDWTDALIILFESAEFVGAVTSEAATRSVDCLISGDAIPRSAVRTVVSIMVPMIVSGVYFIFWALAMFKLNETVEYYVRRSVLSFMAVSYLSYIAITKTAVNVLYCIEVHDTPVLNSDSTTRYWAVDTSLECYSGTHAVLAGLVGWPVLIVFSLGFPVAMVCVLVAARQKHGMQNEWLYQTCGFLYRSYDRTYVFWESVIMLRKAVLAVVVAFSYPLGGNLQGVLAVAVLMLALYFQIVCAPFREEFEDLNQLEGLSLLISSLTFVCGLFYNDDRTSDSVLIFLSTLLVMANLSLFLYFVAMFVKFAAMYMARLMEEEGIAFDPDRWPPHVIKAYMSWRIGEMHLFAQSAAGRFQSSRNSTHNGASVDI